MSAGSRFDGFGNASRVGLNFTERGFGLRPARTVYDRGHTGGGGDAARRCRLATVVRRRGRALAAHGRDLRRPVPVHGGRPARGAPRGESGRRPSSPTTSTSVPGCGPTRAAGIAPSKSTAPIAPYVDVMLGNEEDFTAALGFSVTGVDDDLAVLDPTNFKVMIDEVVGAFPNIQIVATTLRQATTANRNDWGAVAFAEGTFHEAPTAVRPRDLRSRRRRRRFRVGADLCAARRQVGGRRRGIRCSPRGTGDDHTW